MWTRSLRLEGYPKDTEVWGIDATRDPLLHIVLIPGNPGSAGYYTTFLASLHAAFSGAVQITAVTSLGFEVEPTSGDASGILSLDEQCLHKAAFIEQHCIMKHDLPVVVLGHSIGFYMAMKAVLLLENPEDRGLRPMSSWTAEASGVQTNGTNGTGGYGAFMQDDENVELSSGSDFAPGAVRNAGADCRLGGRPPLEMSPELPEVDAAVKKLNGGKRLDAFGAAVREEAPLDVESAAIARDLLAGKCSVAMDASMATAVQPELMTKRQRGVNGRIVKVIGLMPFIETHMHNKLQRKLRGLAEQPERVAMFMGMLEKLPRPMRAVIAGMAKEGMSRDMGDLTAKLMRKDLTLAAFTLARDEFWDLSTGAAWEDLRALADRSAILAAPNDPWWPHLHMCKAADILQEGDLAFDASQVHTFSLNPMLSVLAAERVQEWCSRVLLPDPVASSNKLHGAHAVRETRHKPTRQTNGKIVGGFFSNRVRMRTPCYKPRTRIRFFSPFRLAW